MESKVVLPEPPAQVGSFPLLAESPKGLIVLFSDECAGTVMCAGNSQLHKLGTHRDDWIPVHNRHWNILPKGSTVTLTQG